MLAFMIVTTKMREQKPGATFVERLLGVERRVPYQRGRDSTKSEGGLIFEDLKLLGLSIKEK